MLTNVATSRAKLPFSSLFHIAGIAFFGLLSMYADTAAAKESRYKDVQIPIENGDRLVVSGVQGSVRLTGGAVQIPGGGEQITVRAVKIVADKSSREQQDAFESATFSLHREGKVVHLDVKVADSKSQWIDAIQPGAPEFQIEIEGVNLPTEVNWRSGSVTVQNVQSPVSVALVDGNIRCIQNDGSLHLQAGKGDIKVENHKGKVQIDSQMAKVTLRELDGDVVLDQFSGDAVLDKVRGHVRDRNHSGNHSLSSISGAVDLDLVRTQMTIAGLGGALRGQTEEGSVTAELVGDVEAQLDANSGNISLKLPSGSGASVKAETDDGALFLPDSIRVNKSTHMKSASGKLPGAARGSVALKSKSGTIRVR